MAGYFFTCPHCVSIVDYGCMCEPERDVYDWCRHDTLHDARSNIDSMIAASVVDTDKLKRLAEDERFGGEYMPVAKTDILALIAENERLKEEVDIQRGHASYANQLMDQRVTAMLTRCEERGEAVALLRKWQGADFDILEAECQRETRAFLARIDGGV